LIGKEVVTIMSRKYSILVIDDDRDDLEVITTDLKDRGHDVNGYLYVNEFFNMLRVEKPDAVLVDMVNHELPGWEICQKVKGAFDTDIKVIAMSGILDDEDIDRMKIKADEYLVKPVTVHDVEKALKNNQ